MTRRFALAALTTDEVRAICACPPSAVLLPVGSLEPHGPHLPLETAALIGTGAAERAATVLVERGVATYVAPALPYGVTERAAGFPGAIGLPAPLLTALVEAVVARLLADGWRHVCVVNHHLEPAHDAAVRLAVAGFAQGRVSVASPLSPRWALSFAGELAPGACHAGRYETSLVLAAGGHVHDAFANLPELEVDLPGGDGSGRSETFAALGLDRAYSGDPAAASEREGDALFERLAGMIVTEVLEGLERRGGTGDGEARSRDPSR